MSAGLRAAIALSAFAALGCGVNPEVPGAYLYTLDQLVPGASLGAANPALDWPLADQIVSPAGTEIAWLSDPYVPGAHVLQANDSDGLNVQPAFSEGMPAAYATTEVWDEWPGPVWLQPLYFPITGFKADGSVQFLEPTSPTPIFSIGTDSLFYSSYWQIYYFVVPAGTNADDYVTVKSILDGGFPLVKGALTFCALGPAGVNLAHAQGSAPVEPLTGLTLHPRGASTGWVEGTQVSFIDFGRSRFTLEQGTSDPALVEADALFQFAIRDPATGAHVPLDGTPRVGGTGPYGQHRTPTFAQGRPQFGALWHEYLVLLNPQQGNGHPPPAFFIPNDHAALRAKLVAQALGQPQWAPAPDSSLDAIDPAIAAAYTLRVAANPDVCFLQPNPAFPAGPCVWMDSQTAVESTFPSALIYDTGRQSSCPLVVFNGVEVAP